MKQEIRYINSRVAVEGKKLRGLAARYNSLSNDLGGFRERLAPGSFKGVLNDPELDCRALINHSPDAVLGRTKSGTLQLRETENGLEFSVDLPDTQAARDLHVSISRGDISQCSFSFRCGDDEFSEETDERGQPYTCRTIHSFRELFDISAVTYPAYEDTAVVARAVVPANVLAECRSRVGRGASTAHRVVSGLPIPTITKGAAIAIGRHMAAVADYGRTLRLEQSLARTAAQEAALAPVAITDADRRAHADRVARIIAADCKAETASEQFQAMEKWRTNS